MRIALAGAGAFGEKHLDGLWNMGGFETVSIIIRTGEKASAVAAKYGARAARPNSNIRSPASMSMQ